MTKFKAAVARDGGCVITLIGVFLALFLLTVFLTGCTSLQPSNVKICPVMPVYNPAYEKAVGDRLAQLPPNDPLVKWSIDYITVREEIAQCAR
jgi:hypothetical protein